VGAPPDEVRIRPTPAPEEVAAIMAAMEVLWPRPVSPAEDRVAPPVWRFSGRWWRKPVAARRDRPW
jgi:hypothetical protein